MAHIVEAAGCLTLRLRTSQIVFGRIPVAAPSEEIVLYPARSIAYLMASTSGTHIDAQYLSCEDIYRTAFNMSFTSAASVAAACIAMELAESPMNTIVATVRIRQVAT